MQTELGFPPSLRAAMDDPLPRALSSRAGKRPNQHDDSIPVGADLSVCGVHALFFDGDAVASFINSRKALVPWNGDESLLIDRYDVRHLLQDLSSIRKRRAPSYFLDVTEEELDYERYRDLDGLGENDLSSDEVSKAAAGEYRLVPFSYAEGVVENGKHVESRNEGTSFDPPFTVPGFLLSKLPPSQKIHQIMAGTAKFVSEHGGQSEIILRVKQGNNPTFGFLNPDHYLHEYFRYLVENPELVGGTAKKRPNPAQVSSASGEGLSLLGSIYGTGDDDDDDDDNNNDDRLKAQSLTSLEKGAEVSNDDAADCAVLEVDTPSLKLPGDAAFSDDGSFGSGLSGIGRTSPGLENEVASASIEKIEVSTDITNQQPAGGKESFQICNTSHSPKNGLELEPPSPIKRVIEKMVEFITRNGKEFETVVRDRDKADGRFQFLLPWNEYHSFYLKVLEAAQEEKMKKGKRVILNLRSEKASSQDTSRTNYLGPLSQEKTKGSSTSNASQASEAKVASKSLSQSEKKMKMLIGKTEFIPPNKNNIGQFNNVKVDRFVSLNSESAATNVNGVSRLPVGPDLKAIVVAKDHFVPQGDKDEDYGMTADAAAAVVMAATRGLREVKQDSSNNRTSSSGLGQKKLCTVREASAGGCTEGLNMIRGVVESGMDDVGIAKAVAQAAAFAVAHEADSADARLTPAEKLKAERLRKAKMFAAMIKGGQNVSECISGPLGPPASSRTVGSEAVGSGGNIPTDMINPEVQRVCNSQEYKVSKGSSKNNNRDLESVMEGSSLNLLRSGSSNSKHQLDAKEHRESRTPHEYHLKKRKSHRKDEERDTYISKRTLYHDSGDVKVQNKKLDYDTDDRSHRKSKRSCPEESNGSENKDRHRRKVHRSEATEDLDKHRRKKSHHDYEGDQDGKYRHSEHKQCDNNPLDSASEKQRSSKHQHQSISPSEVKKSGGAKKSGHKEPQEFPCEAIDQLESSEFKRTVDKTADVNEVIIGGESNYTLTAEEVPDDIRAKVRALLLSNS